MDHRYAAGLRCTHSMRSMCCFIAPNTWALAATYTRKPCSTMR
ncbi:hypothetical protein XOC_1058 [Xanthomonas oryzae pv. oryzicola BLS256]|uniref:Uncharacterized protein n=1 Tax=Xanthomonas oryzae pv. oryzicola (strain BLS256) TaxID=383407 RepID=G7TF91_XANOB|nr:hypothetical protein XOC_1058 [Xanthomonas oryzae pv. oryzicola BLS256]QEO98865.1 hypothetical protein XOCgx_3877 [Xanthomonas oryzae pv. oryzicola]